MALGNRDRDWGKLLLATLLLGGCPSDTAPPRGATPAPVTEQEPEDVFSPFSFGPTMRSAAPSSFALIPVAEIGVAQRRRMRAVTATFNSSRSPALSIDLWTFTQQGEEDILAPDGDPRPLIDLTGAVKPDPAVLSDLRGEMSMPRAVTTNPQGLDVATASAALRQLGVDAALAMDDTKDGHQRVTALAAVVRGLDSELWLSNTLPRTLARLSAPGLEVVSDTGGAHRSSLRVSSGEEDIDADFLRKRGGWVLTTLRKHGS